MHRLRAAVVLLLVAAAWAPTGSGGTADDPELSDPAGDQSVQRSVPGQVPAIPGVTDDTFDDVDLVAAWWQEGAARDCTSAPVGTCPTIDLVVATTSSWSGGTLTATFRLLRGPTSYAHSNATLTGQEFTITVTGTSVTGLANATAAVDPDGLRIRLPVPRLGAVGGDVLAGLNLTATRTDRGLVTDPTATQDDATGTDTAGPGAAYTFDRPAPQARIDVSVVRTGNATGNSLTVQDRGAVPVQLRIANLGTDPDSVSLQVSSDPPLADAPVLPAVQTPLAVGGETVVTVAVSLAEARPGPLRVTFTATSERGATDDAVVTIVYAPAAAQREVVPAGLDFLTPAAEATGLDDAFGKYAELVLLALLVLLVILTVFLLVALAPSRLAGVAAPEAPPVAGSEAAPAGVLPAAAATKASAARGAQEPEDVPGPAAGAGDAALAIESVTHEPEAPEEGETVRTEVVLRNPGATRQVRVVLSLDGHDEDDKAVTLPARATKTVRLGWIAGPGENKVRVRVLPA